MAFCSQGSQALVRILLTLRRFDVQEKSGKSYWLLYAMIRLIQQGNEPFMLYFTSQILLFYNDVVFQMNPLGVNITVPSRKGHYMFMLIDTDLQRSPPPDICTSPNVFPVHAASPNPVHYSAWMGQYPEAVTIGMPLWSYEELYAAYVALFSL